MIAWHIFNNSDLKTKVGLIENVETLDKRKFRLGFRSQYEKNCEKNTKLYSSY